MIYNLSDDYNKALRAAVAELKGGGIAAFPTETVYGLGALATDGQAVSKVFTAKGRPGDNPLIVHVASVEQARALSSGWGEMADALSEAFWPGPISLVVPSNGTLPHVVTAGLDTVALRMPDNRFALDLIAQCGPVAAPSANKSGRPSPVTAEHVAADFELEVIVDGGECGFSYESTVVDCTGSIPEILRPGGVTRDMIAGVCGDCAIAEGVFEPAGAGAKSPGMLHRHYAPGGEAILVLPGGEQLDEIKRLYDASLQNRGKPVIIICMQDAPLLGGRRHIVCGQRDDMARGLFAALRQADKLGAGYVVIQGAQAEGSGMAYMNRALRAAGFNTAGKP